MTEHETVTDFARATTRLILDDVGLLGRNRELLGEILYSRLLAAMECLAIAVRGDALQGAKAANPN